MVGFARVLTNLLAWLVLTAIASAAPAKATPASPAPVPVRKALEAGHYPWYNARTDSVEPVWPPREWELDLDWLDRWLRRLNLSWLPSAGQLIAYGLAMAGLAILVAVLVVLWRNYRPGAEGLLGRARAAGPGKAARVEDLPEGLRPETDDPWSEAVRCRARGDYARAVVCLFVHQLLTLDRLRQLRLVPGRTARQLVRGIPDREFRSWVEATLRLFEDAYYGHRLPSAEAFEPVWTAAEAFERRIAEGVAR
jgi:hypothetical protein